MRKRKHRHGHGGASKRCHPVSVMRLVRNGALPPPIKLTGGGPCLKEAEIQQALAHRETVRLGGGHNASAF
jgi:hypothetical protein